MKLIKELSVYYKLRKLKGINKKLSYYRKRIIENGNYISMTVKTGEAICIPEGSWHYVEA